MTHPFHPLKGCRFELLDSGHAWGADRVYYLNEAGEAKSLPSSWTDACMPDPYVVVSKGRSVFRTCDLLSLVRLVNELNKVRESMVSS
ncbi:MAG: Y4bD/Y4pK family protein [Candidatus Obscuribacterales bacterium]|nr:Y4bD/Y4pK family protein [Candidatus Obscuribacterales bacterium]